MTDLSPNDLSHLTDEEFNALAPQGYHATGPAKALSLAAQEVLNAFDQHADPYNYDTSGLVAALRAAADQVVPEEPGGGMAPRRIRQSVRRQLLSIAAELDQHS